MNPQDEAIIILREVIRDLTSPNRDLFAIMRQCQYASEILGWQPVKDWFYQELNGYYPDNPLPQYRKINGIKKWQFNGSLYEGIEYQTEETMHKLDPRVYTEEPDILEVKAGISWFLRSS